jgi:hypothetical protein
MITYTLTDEGLDAFIATFRNDYDGEQLAIALELRYRRKQVKNMKELGDELAAGHESIAKSFGQNPHSMVSAWYRLTKEPGDLKKNKNEI